MKINFLKTLWNKIFGGSSSAEVTPMAPSNSQVKIIEANINNVIAGYFHLCPGLYMFNPSLKFWQDVIKSMVKAESNFTATMRYQEKDISDLDAVTGMKIFSEGFLQLSQQDSKFHGCEFDWNVDSRKVVSDSTKTIFDMRRNIECGMKILNKQVEKEGSYINNRMYWAVLRPSRPGHKEFLSAFEYYSKLSPDPKPELPAEEIKEVESLFGIKKIAIIVGHGYGDPGATCFNGMSEFAYNEFVAKEIAATSFPGKEVELFWRGAEGIKGVARKAVNWSPNLTLELHLNSFNGAAKGIEVLVLKGDTKSIKLGKHFAAQFAEYFKPRTIRRDQGINEVDDERGSASLNYVSSVEYSLLVEPFFCDNPSDYIEPIKYIGFLQKWINLL